MFPYITLLLIISILLCTSRFFKVRVFYYISGLILILFSGFRKVGKDFDSYNLIFDSIKTGNYDEFIEPINILLIELGSYLQNSNSNSIIFLIYSFLTICGVIYFINKNSVNKELSLYIFIVFGVYYLSTFNVMRQWLALSFFLVFLEFLFRKKYLLFFIITTFLSFIHLSALLLIVSPLLRVRHKAINVLFLFFLLPAFHFLAPILLENSIYIHYLSDEFKYVEDDPILKPATFVYLLINFFFLYKFKYFDKQKFIEERLLVFLNMCIASIFVLVFSYILGLDFQVAMRANIYFIAQYLILVPASIESLSKLKRLTVGIIIVLLLTVYFILSLYFNGESINLLPYVL